MLKLIKQKGTLLIIAGVICILCAAALVCFNIHDSLRAKQDSETVLIKIKEIIQQSSDPASPSTELPDPDSSGSDGVQEEVVPYYVLNPDMEMPCAEIDGRKYIGTIAIPSMSIELPVLEWWSYPGLKIAPGRYKGSPYKNNLIIAAHNYDSHFGHLKDLIAGDDIIFTDMDGNIFKYKVALVDTLMPTAVHEMEAGDWDMTLFTCTLGGQMRVTVRCYKA